MIAALARHGLAVAGAFHPVPEDGAPAKTGTLCLVGAEGARMWAAFQTAPEAGDGRPDPLDRWSRRVLEAVAAETGAAALFPFDGPPWPPFLRWAARGEGAAPSPVAMPVSPRRGLWMSYRGALAYPERLALPPRPSASPCAGCPAPCRTACPAGAFAGGGYDVAACVRHVAGPEGAACRDGCLVRRTCPAGREAAPPTAQCRFHMRAFVEAQAPH